MMVTNKITGRETHFAKPRNTKSCLSSVSPVWCVCICLIVCSRLSFVYVSLLEAVYRNNVGDLMCSIVPADVAASPESNQIGNSFSRRCEFGFIMG